MSAITFIQNGDWLGFVVAMYATTMGDVFFGGIIFAMTFPLYMRTQSLTFTIMVATIMVALMEILIPAGMISFARMLWVIGTATVFYLLFTGTKE